MNNFTNESLLKDANVGMGDPPAHKHAALMLEYAKDAAESKTPWVKWEHRPVGYNAYFGRRVEYDWKPISDHPEWNTELEYRRKPTEEPKMYPPEGTRYYYWHGDRLRVGFFKKANAVNIRRFVDGNFGKDAVEVATRKLGHDGQYFYPCFKEKDSVASFTFDRDYMDRRVAESGAMCSTHLAAQQLCDQILGGMNPND